MMLFIIFLFVSYVLICYAIVIKGSSNNNKLSKQDMKIENIKNKITQKRRNIEYEYYRIIDDLEQTLGEQNISVNFEFREFGLFKKWQRGIINSKQVVDKFHKINIKQATSNKFSGKLDKYVDTHRLPIPAENAFRNAIRQLKQHVEPDYEVYLKFSKKYFEHLAKIDSKQVILIHGQTESKNEGLLWREVTLNQAIKYIKATRLDSETVTKFGAHDCMVIFQKFTDTNTITEWFLMPKTYKKIFCDIFRIKTNQYLTNEPIKWLEAIERQMKGDTSV